jgi:RNA polymerase sigma-70 factor (ECF subfamily)
MPLKAAAIQVTILDLTPVKTKCYTKSMASTNQDQVLVERCLTGDARAFDELINRYKRQVFALVSRLIRNQSDAEDVAQETFIKAYRNLSSYDPAYPFLTWLFKIAHNSAIDFLRAQKPESLSIHDEDNPLDIEDTQLSLEEKIEASSQQELIEKVLSTLPPLYREILVLRHQQELSYDEIAESLSIPVGTVKIRLFRARDIMKQKLIKLGYG